MNTIEKTVKVLEELRCARGIEILMIKMSVISSDIFLNSKGTGYKIEKGKKYVEKFSDIEVFIDPYVKSNWVQIYYRTPVERTKTYTINSDNTEK